MASKSVEAKMNIGLGAVETFTYTSVPAATAAEADKEIDHTALDVVNKKLNASSTPAITKIAAFTATLVAGALSLDLSALTGTDGETVDGTGLKVQAIFIQGKSTNTGVITIVPGATNGLDLFGASSSIAIDAGQSLAMDFNDKGTTIGASDEELDLSGTLVEALDFIILLG